MSNKLKSVIQSLLLLEDEEDDEFLILLALLLHKRRKESTVAVSKISVEDVLCQECFTILERASLNLSSGSVGTVVRSYGHQQVCFVCGSSILRAKTHRVSIDSCEGNVIMSCIPTQQVHRLERVCLRCWTNAYRSVRRQTEYDEHKQQQIVQEEAVASQENIDVLTSRHEARGVPPSRNEIKVFCPKCNTEVSHTAEGIQEDQTKILVAKVYHYFEQEYEELKKIYGDLDLTPLSKFRQRTALATGVSETKLLQILKEEEERIANKRREPPQKRRAARKRRRQTDSSSEEGNSDGNIDDIEQPSCADETQTVVVKIETPAYNNEEPENSEVIVPAEMKVEPSDSEIDNEEPEIFIPPVKLEPSDGDNDKEQTDPISLDVKPEPRDDEMDTTNETPALNEPAATKRRKISRNSDDTSTQSSPSGERRNT